MNSSNINLQSVFAIAIGTPGVLLESIGAEQFYAVQLLVDQLRALKGGLCSCMASSISRSRDACSFNRRRDSTRNAG